MINYIYILQFEDKEGDKNIYKLAKQWKWKQET